MGRDAADVPITHTFGPNMPVGFKVRTDEVSKTRPLRTSSVTPNASPLLDGRVGAPSRKSRSTIEAAIVIGCGGRDLSRIEMV
jgi:hypothetical protein